MSIFNQSQSTKVKKNKFNLSHDKKLSLQMGKLIPILNMEVLPGDNFRVNSEIMLRLAPMIAPILHRVNVYTHYFFVPNRIIWNQWEEFITGGKDGTSAPFHPVLAVDTALAPLYAEKSLADYMGVPTIGLPNPGVTNYINSLPFRAYLEIYNNYYRDQTLEDEIFFTKDTGNNGVEPTPSRENLLTMRYRAWEKDYFSSALPWTQRGVDVGALVTTDKAVLASNGGNPGPNAAITTDNEGDGLEAGGAQAVLEGSLLITELRKAARLQEWLEKNARGGARYIEQLLSHWGRAPKDERLQRPEYLGGGKQPIVISEVLNTAGSESIGLDPVGEMAGHGISVGSQNGFNKTFDEHGWIIGIMSVVPKSAYMQGIHKHFLRKDKFDYAWPEFANIGEQPIYNRELFFDGTISEDNDQVFGYTPRYAEYKYGISTVHGELKTNLDFWHMARKFAALPTLSKDFVMIDPSETKRIFAVTDTDTDDIYAQIYHNIDALRPLPYFGTPKL